MSSAVRQWKVVGSVVSVVVEVVVAVVVVSRKGKSRQRWVNCSSRVEWRIGLGVSVGVQGVWRCHERLGVARAVVKEGEDSGAVPR